MRIRELKMCSNCGESVPTINGRFCFHLVMNSRFRICPGSGSGTDLCAVSTVGEPKPARGRVRVSGAKAEKPLKRSRNFLCKVCILGNHLLCEDGNCNCSCADALDQPYSLYTAGYRIGKIFSKKLAKTYYTLVY
jgi:hypothetical protein